MIPKFPEFKKIELSDREEIESFTSKQKPYSDFVFENIWSWNIQGRTKLSILHGNLVVIFEDVLSNDLVCSFFGNNAINETIADIVDLKESDDNIFDYVGLVPEISIYGIDLNKYFIEIDLNSCDYIFSIEKMASYEGHQFYKKRRLSESFAEEYPDAELKILDVRDDKTKEQILELNQLWIQHKSTNGFDLTNYREHEALAKFLDLNVDNLSTVGVLYKEKLIGYVISKALPDNYAIGLFGKFNRAYHGLNEYLMSCCAKELLKVGSQFYNAGEDLGMQGLRISKNSYSPIAVLRKYSINK